jgi:hypothetical protein
VSASTATRSPDSGWLADAPVEGTTCRYEPDPDSPCEWML